MKTNKKTLIVLLNIFLLTTFVTIMSCFTDEEEAQILIDQCVELIGAPTTSSDWVSFVNWDNAIIVEITAEEHGGGLYDYTHENIEFIAGQPYILKLKMEPGNQEKHYFHAPEFFKAIATRKVQTTNAEYKAPYFDDIELVINGEAELFFVPVLAGTYDLICTIPGHEDGGMEMTIEILCGDGLSLDLEVDPNFSTVLGSDPRRSGSNPVWDSKITVEISMVEIDDHHFVFEPATVNLTVDQGYVLKLINPSSNSSKHYYTAVEFFQTLVTRKAEDSRAEIKVPYFNAVEILIGGYTELFVVPTEAGTYNVVCTVSGHVDAGMFGTIVVE
ncbi:MAG: hypothetical protein DRI75_11120 [Bacteroidetes bacterium]|nr:MAG: hypothetical protein DRI75_11120 [Bacteroidota bacterium]